MKMKQIKDRQKSIFLLAIALFLVIFLVSVSASGLHHHKDGFAHNDCPLCIAGNQLYKSCQNCPYGNVSLTVTDIDLPQEPLFYGSVHVTHTSLRAPPA